MRVHLVQIDSEWEDPVANHERLRSLISAARVRDNDLIVLPEMFDTGFSFNLAATADASGRTLNVLRSIARELGVTIHGSRTVLGPDGKGRNCATAVGHNGTLLAEYYKIHPFSYGREAEHFSPGDRIVTYPWIWGRAADQRTVVAPTICYDLRFPELYRHGMLAGAELFPIGANWPAPRKVHRRALAIARAIENLAFVVCVNRAGADPFLAYEGGSVAIDHQGEILAEAGAEETVLTVDLDFAALRRWRDEFPALRDARLLTRSVTADGYVS